MRLRFALVAALLSAGAATAEPGDLARAAAAELAEATILLDQAETRADRIAALTETIRAYERGLAAMREGLRHSAADERALRARVAQGQAEFAKLSTLLQTLSRAPEARGLLHPGGAKDSVRAAMLTAELLPAIREKTARYRDDLRDLMALLDVQKAGIAALVSARDDIGVARLSLAEAIANRTDLPPRLSTDDAAMEALLNSSETLAAFADSLVSETASGAMTKDWPLPVTGRVIRQAGEADPDGIRRPGWTIATAPEALLTAPAQATVRFTGTLDNSGEVMILETAPGRLLILSGFGSSYVRRDQIVVKGEPLGLMGPGHPTQENLNETALRDGQPDSETLYIEVRQAQAPVDPTAFFRVIKQ